MAIGEVILGFVLSQNIFNSKAHKITEKIKVHV
jgi:hypothetical protein